MNYKLLRCEEIAELTVHDKLWYLRHHADLQAAGHLQGQSRVARLGEALTEAA